MAYDKLTTFKLVDAPTVWNPSGRLIKLAAQPPVLPDGQAYSPEFLYVTVRAISAGEYWGPNRNADYFEESELLNSYPTFLNAHFFLNHQNTDVANAKGSVLRADWNDGMKYVELLLKIDRKLAPEACRNFETGTVTDVSMGCRVKYTLCSICGNKATKKEEFCDHVKHQRGQILEDGRQVYEVNRGCTFHDISQVLSGADRTAKITQKVARRRPTEMLEKAAAQDHLHVTPAHALPEGSEGPLGRALLDTTAEDVAEALEKVAAATNRPRARARYADVMTKLADIEKVLRGRLMDVGAGDSLGQALGNGAQALQAVRVGFTPHWDDDATSALAGELADQASQYGVPLHEALDDFLQGAEANGIRLSPLEMGGLMGAAAGAPPQGLTPAMSALAPNYPGMFQVVDQAPEDLTPDEAASPVGSLLPIFQALPDLAALASQSTQPVITVVRVIRGRLLPGGQSKTASTGDHAGLRAWATGRLAEFAPERSFHAPYLLPRLEKIAADPAAYRQPDGPANYLPALLLKSGSAMRGSGHLKAAAAAYAWAQYERARERMLDDPGFLALVERRAAEIASGLGLEKMAVSPFKALLFGVPTAYAYSTYQRARIQNGQPTSAFGRWVAQYPSAALGTALVPAPMAFDSVRRRLGNVGRGIGDTAVGMRDAFRRVGESMFKRMAGQEQDLREVLAGVAEDAPIERALVCDLLHNPEIDAAYRGTVAVGLVKMAATADALTEDRRNAARAMAGDQDIRLFLAGAAEHLASLLTDQVAAYIPPSLACFEDDPAVQAAVQAGVVRRLDASLGAFRNTRSA